MKVGDKNCNICRLINFCAILGIHVDRFEPGSRDEEETEETSDEEKET